MAETQQCECTRPSMSHTGRCTKTYRVGSIFLREYIRSGVKVWLCPDCDIKSDIEVKD